MPQVSANPVCIGTGLVALDVVISNESNKPPRFLAGGSCGNVLTILSYLGWQSYPIARLSNNVATELLMEDLAHWGVHVDLLSFTVDGSTPIIIHRILKDKHGVLKHRFEFRNPEDGKYLPSYKPYLSKLVDSVFSKSPKPKAFYFDRINRASVDLAKKYKSQGSAIIFEPSSSKDEKGFIQSVKVADVVKFAEDRISNFDDLFPLGEANIEIRTLGKHGLEFRYKGQANWIHVPGFEIDNVVDTAGAGDWCTAGIIFKLFSESEFNFSKSKTEVVNALKFGQVLSALNCTYEGARGLMYDCSRHTLISKASDIAKSKVNYIPSAKHSETTPIPPSKPVKIASLFA